VHHTHRFTMRRLLLQDLPHSVWHVDKGLLYTLRKMVTQPGRTIAEYLAGRRAQHFRPLTYLLLICGVSSLLMSATQWHPIPAERAAEMPKVLNLAMERYMTVFYKYPSLVYTVLLPINALLAWLLLRATRYNYAEMLISQALITGTLTVPALLMGMPIMWLAGRSEHSPGLIMLTALPSLVYPAWVYLQMLNPTPLSTAARWVRAVGTALLQVLAQSVAGLGLIIYFIVSMLKQDPALRADMKEKLGKKPAQTEQPAPARR
jgi:hypothetical protein